MSDLTVIAGRRAQWMAAFHAADIPAMSEFVTSDTRAMPPSRPPLVGLEASQEFWREGFAAAKTVMSTRDHEVSVDGDLAIDRFAWEQRITLLDSDQTLTDGGSCLWVWRRDADGAWKIAEAIWNSDRTEPGIWSGGD